MTTAATGIANRDDPSTQSAEKREGTAQTSRTAGLGRDERDLLSVFFPILGILALAAIGVDLISGQFPWFFVSLGVFVFFASCLPWRRFL